MYSNFSIIHLWNNHFWWNWGPVSALFTDEGFNCVKQNSGINVLDLLGIYGKRDSPSLTTNTTESAPSAPLHPHKQTHTHSYTTLWSKHINSPFCWGKTFMCRVEHMYNNRTRVTAIHTNSRHSYSLLPFQWESE